MEVVIIDFANHMQLKDYAYNALHEKIKYCYVERRYVDMNSWKQAGFLIICILIGFMFAGCAQNEIKYYSNPNILFGEELSKQELIIGDYTVGKFDSKLHIQGDNIAVELDLKNYVIQSLHLSYDQKYIAFDAKSQNGIKVFVVNLETGEYENILETIGYEYDYDGYKVPLGLAWSPKQNIIAFIGGYHGSPRVKLYHLDMDLNKQGHLGSRAYPGSLYGVKWDTDGKSIYYVVDNGDEDYILYQTEIMAEDFLMGGKIVKVDELTYDEFMQWIIC